MTPADFRAARKTLGLSARGIAAALSGDAARRINPRTIRRWERGDSPIPAPVATLLPRLIAEAKSQPGRRR